MQLPNFFVIGAAKAGTTALYYYLRNHPKIYLNPSIKETNFFAYDENNAVHTSDIMRFPIRTMDDYLALFKDILDQKAIGDASPAYMGSELAARRIRQLAPSARIIASLRNPVDRSYSAYVMRVRLGTETRPIEAIPAEEQQWFRGSLYYMNLKRYYDFFGCDQVKTILFDDLKLDSLNVIAEICRFLDVDDSFQPDTNVNYNPGGIPRNRLIHNLLTAFGNPYVRKKIKTLIPERWHHHVITLRSKNMLEAPKVSFELRSKWLEYYRDDILRTQDLIGRDLNHWLKESNS